MNTASVCLESCLKIYECTACSGKHTANAPSTLDPWLHQRLVDIEVATAPVAYFAVLGGDAGSGPNGDISFEIFRHGEDFTSTYNVRLEKYDWETGQPLAGALGDEQSVPVHKVRQGSANLFIALQRIQTGVIQINKPLLAALADNADRVIAKITHVNRDKLG